MTLATERVRDSRATQLKRLIDVLVDIVGSYDGPASQREVMRKAAREAGVSISEMPYVVNTAVADRKVTTDLRSGKIALVS